MKRWWESTVIPGTIAPTSFTTLDGACQLFTSPDLDNHELPPFVQDLLHIFRHIDNLTCRNNLVVSVNVSIIHLLVPKAVFCLSVFVNIIDLIAIQDTTLSAQRC